MTGKEAVDYIHSLMRFGSRPGLSRIKRLLHEMGDPQNKLKIIHVAGTNGKGSVCTFAAACLTAAGMKTGLYTSPFVTSFTERIRIDGECIGYDELGAHTKEVKDLSDKLFGPDDPVTEFEFITALAFRYFADKGCDAVVLEVGLGGRLDATNVIEKPLVSVITRIDLDHMAVLGDIVEKIAAEKCGIIKDGCPVVMLRDNLPAAASVIKDFAARHGSRLIVPEIPDDITDKGLLGSEFYYRGMNIKVPLAGHHQVGNAATAIEAVLAAFPDLPPSAIESGIANVRFPARCEVISREPLVLLDGSHNPNGTAALDGLLNSCGINNAVCIAGFMADKDVKDAFLNVASHFKKAITVTVKSNSRSMTAIELAHVCKNCGCDAMPAEGYDKAIEMALSYGAPLIVFGSLYLAGDIRPLLLSRFSTKDY